MSGKSYCPTCGREAWSAGGYCSLQCSAAVAGHRLAAIRAGPAAGERGYREKLAELYQWTGSAFLAGEAVEDEGAEKAALYGFLCGLLGYVESAAEAASRLATLTAQAAEVERLKAALEAAKAYFDSYLVDEHEMPDMCGVQPDQHEAICRFHDALAALSREEG